MRGKIIGRPTFRASYLYSSMQGRYPQKILLRPSLKPIFDSIIRQVAATDASILITGESGVGKEVLAEIIHNESDRSGPFIAVDIAVSNDELLESYLFGHEKGAFTGATKLHKGKLELAHGGTFFLDEIGNIPLATQAKLLRAIELKTFYRTGGEIHIYSDFRLICATNCNLRNAIAARTFREDLYHRINVIPINIPPLRGHMEDIQELSKLFLKESCMRAGRELIEYSGKLREKIENCSWKGSNVRELKNMIQRIVLLYDKIDIGEIFNMGESQEIVQMDEKAVKERARVVAALEEAGWIKVKAAKILGVSYKQLYNLMHKYNIPLQC